MGRTGFSFLLFQSIFCLIFCNTRSIFVMENLISDVGESLNEAAVSVKEAVIGAVKNIGSGADELASDVHDAEQKIDKTLDKTLEKTLIINQPDHVLQKDDNDESLYKTIPLKDSNHISDDKLDDFKEMLSHMTDQNDTSDANPTMNSVDDLKPDVKNRVLDSVQEFTEIEINDKTPTHSLDSLKTSTPEPEIINAMLNDVYKSAPSPKPTLAEMKSIEEMDDVLANKF